MCVYLRAALASGLLFVFFLFEGSTEKAHALLWSGERTVVVVLTGFCNYSVTQTNS